MTERPLAVLCDCSADLDRGAATATARGWSVRAGFELPQDPWDLSWRRWVCVGVVATEADAAAAIWVLVRGCALVVVVEGSAPPNFLDDLQRCADLERLRQEMSATGLGPHEDALLAALADGLSVHQAATKLFLSTRTAQRRLTSARAALGVRTTREAVMAWTRQSRGWE
jgi:hypothetical protein